MAETNGYGPAGLASDLVIQGAEVVAIEHDQMRKFAVVQRRDPATSLTLAINELKAFPEEAEKAYYRLPRRSKKCSHKSNTTCKDCTWIEGPSVGTARVVARNWGNCTAGVRVANETEEYWDLEGRFLDFETNFSSTRGLRVLKRVKWGGQLKHVSELDPTVEFQIFQAGVSKCYRNVVRDGIPEAIINRYWRTAKELAVGKTPGKKLSKGAVKKVLDAFKPLGVAPEMLEDKCGRKMDAWTGQDAAELKGIHTAITEGHITVAAVFGIQVAEPEPIEEPQPEPEPAPPENEAPPVDPEKEDGLFK